MAQQEHLELYGDGTGLVKSDSITVAADSQLFLFYKTNKCYSAWLEIEATGNAMISKIPILTVKPLPSLAFKAGTKITLVASMGEGHSITTTLILK